MYTLRLTNTETGEIMENIRFDLAEALDIFNDRVNILTTVNFDYYELELEEDGACLAFAAGLGVNGGLLWKTDEEDADFGDWDLGLLDKWREKGIEAPLPLDEGDEFFRELFDDFGIDDDYIDEWNEADDFGLFEDEY